MNGFDRTSYLDLIRGKRPGLAASLVRSGLWIAAWAYGAVVSLRNLGFDRGWLKAHRATVPVVSVGNLTLGGTGKTPMVEWVARWFRQRGIRVAILSRGYGQEGGLNDEGRVLEENLPDVPHLQGPDRVTLARLAVVEVETELIVLDDGFQHRRLARDVDLVLIDALEPFGLEQLFPRGLLREPIRSLTRASVVVLSRADLINADERAAIRSAAETAARRPLRWAEARHAPLCLVDNRGMTSPLEKLGEMSVAAFCGIGNPEGFRRTVVPLCRKLLDLRIFPDHYNYSAIDVLALERWADGLGADFVLTTQKDLVKLRASVLGLAPLRALRIGLEVTEGGAILDDVLTRLAGDSSRG
ncbi:MAG: tetraacyldisaccharide 4'-kinase [Isosphaeraceae bacterium]